MADKSANHGTEAMTDGPAVYEKQYERLLEIDRTEGRQKLGLMSNQSWRDDPRHLVVYLARYKFVAKMLEGFGNVLEVGCGDAFASRIVQQTVSALSVTDVDEAFLEDVGARQDSTNWPFKEIFQSDLLDGDGLGDRRYEAAYALDVLEHIAAEREDDFIAQIGASLADHGTGIFGMPSLESQVHASPLSKEGHVNCKTGPDFKATMQRHFQTVFLFSMNDEVVHTGFHKMAHYLFAVCVGPRRVTSGVPKA